MVQSRSVSIAILALVVLVGCDSENATETVQVRDSAGVQILEHAAGAAATLVEWRLQESPLLEIGAAEGDPSYQLFRVFSAARLGDGRIVVANGGTHELRFYDETGGFIRAVGREGGGPGEFRNLASVSKFADDSLVVWDWGNSRLTFYDGQGNLARSVNLLLGVGLPLPVGILADGQLLVISIGLPSPGRSGVLQDSASLYRYSADGEPLDSLIHFAYSDLHVRSGDEGLSVMRIPFGATTQVAALSDGFYLGNPATYEIRHYAADGTLRRVIRREHTKRPVTPADIERYKERRLELTGEPDARARLRRDLDALPYPETMPAYSRIAVDAEGNLWVAEYVSPGEPGRWTVFDSGGRMIATLETPPGFAVHEIGSDCLLGRWLDEMEVEHVQVFRLAKD